MTDKLLPPGNYAVRLLIVGSADIDGNILFAHWTVPATPPALAACVTKGIDVLVPKGLERIVAGSWLVLQLENRPSTWTGCVLAEQIAITGDVDRDKFRDLVLENVPFAVEKLAASMLELIGIEPINYHEPAQRPVHLN